MNVTWAFPRKSSQLCSPNLARTCVTLCGCVRDRCVYHTVWKGEGVGPLGGRKICQLDLISGTIEAMPSGLVV